MPIMWSRIHAELGMAPCPLTYDMIAAAVGMRVREAADLDWKLVVIPAAELSGQGKGKAIEDRRREFAKDVTAMANSQGGLIVHDVQEQADGIEHVPLGERERQRLSSWASTMIRPWLKGLVIDEFPGPGDSSSGFLVVSVPASPDTPHVVEDRDKIWVPYRDGAHTSWMSEYQVERAYRARFERQTGSAAALNEQLEDVRQFLARDAGAWLIVATRPTSPVPHVFGDRPERQSVGQTYDQAQLLSEQIFPGQGGGMLAPLGTNRATNPRAGLRRWVATDNVWGSAEDLSKYIHFELHHDGACTIAFNIEDGTWSLNNDSYHWVHVLTVGTAIADSIALASAHARGRGNLGDMLVAAELVRGARNKFGAVDRRRIGGMNTGELILANGSRMVSSPKRVETGFAADSDLTQLRQVAHQLDSDLVHQFGVLNGTVPTEYNERMPKKYAKSRVKRPLCLKTRRTQRIWRRSDCWPR